MVNAGDSYDYDVHFPTDEPPGLYWYRPHIHGISEAAVLGGASGAIVVDGIENVNPEDGRPARAHPYRPRRPGPGNATPGGRDPFLGLSR